jgi:O-methyltransferase
MIKKQFGIIGRYISLALNRMHIELSRALGHMEGKAAQALEELILCRFFNDNVGKPYQIDRSTKKELVRKIKLINKSIPSGTSWIYHIILATEILKLPASASLEGHVIECGCWKGASTASLSLICSLAGRKLIVCDSFEGLPDGEDQITRNYPHLRVFGYYRKGMYEGRLEEVKRNIENFGDISVCEFKVGFFNESLKTLRSPIVFAFLDVDLTASMKDCIKYIWPFLVDGGCIYTDDSCDMEVVRVWFDEQWWQKEIGEKAPGYVGSGCGLPINPDLSTLGYTRKVRNIAENYQRISWLYYPDAKSR